MKTLEYYKIIDQLTVFTVSDLGRIKVKTIQQSITRIEVLKLIVEMVVAVL